MTSLLVAKLSLVALAGTYLPLFLGVRRGRRAFAALSVAAAAALLTFSALALQTRADLARLLTSNPGLLAAGALGALTILAGATALAWRFPTWALPFAVAVAPLRVPIPVGTDTVHALVPLYGALLAVLGAEIVLRDRLRPPPQAARDPVRVSLALLMGFACVSTLWAGLHYAAGEAAFAAALVELLAFYLPFSILFALTWRYVRSQAALQRVMMAIVVMGTILAVVGIAQRFTHFIVLNHETILREAELGHGFRVNSLLWDPNMLSRLLLVVILFAAALAVSAPRHRAWLVPCALVALVADAFTLSRSGWIMLVLAGLSFALATMRGRRTAAVLIAAVILLGSTVTLAAVRDVHITTGKLSKPWGINKLTGGRYYLVQSGVRMFTTHPFHGVGVGSFPLAYEAFRDRHAPRRLKESHTTPVTAMAEGGVPGLLAYIAAIAALVWCMRRATGRSSSPGERPLAIAAAAGLGAITLLSLVYNAFFEDAMVWILMAILSALAARRPRPATLKGSEPRV